MRDNRDICVFAFEPNPAHYQRHLDLQKAYSALGWRYHPIQAGLGDTEGTTINFYHNDQAVPANNKGAPVESGFSVVDRVGRDNRKEVVPNIHFAKWIEREIIGRQMPAMGVYGKYDNLHSHLAGKEGKVALKLDIEGMEFLVAPSLIFSGVMCQAIDVAWGEFHAQGHIATREAMDPLTGQGELPPFPGDWRVPQRYFNTLWKAMKSVNPQDCRSQWLRLFDEEDYVQDGIPLPTTSSTTTTTLPITTATRT